jgi:small subunit ribosomal protein S1
MTANPQRWDSTPPPPAVDEGYWAALLREGEYAEAATPESPNGAASPSRTFSFQPDPDAPNSMELQVDWDAIKEVMDADETLELTVIGYNRGGLLVEWRSLRGFVPASQLVEGAAGVSPNFNGRDGRRSTGLSSSVGHTLRLRVIELSQEHNRLILSERAARALPGERADLLSRLTTGALVSGVVTNLCDFGAFIDLGGLEGLIHISELSWGRVGHPGDILKRGVQVEVYVLEVNRDAGRIALSLKRMRPDPWETVNQRYEIGQYVSGIVTNVVDFGAFARIEDGLEGLIHVSELAEGHFLHPRNVVAEGQTVVARILSIDGRARRLGLSLRTVE